MFDHHSRMIYSSLVCFLLLSFPLSLLLCAPPPPSSPVHEERSHVDADVVVDEMEVSEGDADGCKCRVAVNNDVVADVVADVVDDGVERESGDTVAAAAAAAAAAADNDNDNDNDDGDNDSPAIAFADISPPFPLPFVQILHRLTVGQFAPASISPAAQLLSWHLDHHRQIHPCFHHYLLDRAHNNYNCIQVTNILHFFAELVVFFLI